MKGTVNNIFLYENQLWTLFSMNEFGSQAMHEKNLVNWETWLK